MKRVDLLPLDRGLEAEVEVLQRLDGRKTARSHGRGEAPAVAQRDLGGQQQLDGLGRGGSAAVHACEHLVEGLRVLDQPSALGPLVAGDDSLHLVEQQLRRHAAEVGERRLQPPHYDRHRLALVELQPHPPRIAQHHDQRVPLAPRQPEVREVHLALVARRRLEPPDRLHRLLRPHRADVTLHLAVAARIARCLHLVEQPHGAQLRILGQPGVDDPLVGIELRRPPWSGSVPHRLAVRAPVQLPRLDPVVHGPPADLQMPGDLGLGNPLLEIMSQEHPLLSPDHCASSVQWRRKIAEPAPEHPPTSGPTPYLLRPPDPEVCRFGRPHL